MHLAGGTKILRLLPLICPPPSHTIAKRQSRFLQKQWSINLDKTKNYKQPQTKPEQTIIVNNINKLFAPYRRQAPITLTFIAIVMLKRVIQLSSLP